MHYDIEEMCNDPEAQQKLKEKVEVLVGVVRNSTFQHLMRNFTTEELMMVEQLYGNGFVYRMLPDVLDILEIPYEGSTLH